MRATNFFRFILSTPPLVAVSLLCCSALQAQLGATQLKEKFERYNENVLQEKLYMHVDRNFYLAGELLWCKLYVVDAMLHQPLDVSKVAYVEVLDENNAPALQAKIGLTKGKGYGSITMPVTIKSGNYKVRAYTNWMKNNGPDYFFEKMITIVNTQKSRELPSTGVQAAAPDIRFFPEGGNLVNGLSSKVACKIVGMDGRGIDYTATLIDETNRTIASFQSLKFGMGHFVFTPEKGHTYQAVLQAGNNRYTKSLPFVFDKGYVMQVSGGNGAPVSVNVQSNSGDSKLLLLAQTRQSFKTVLQADVQNGKANFSIDASQLGEGISQLTVLNTEGRAVCERLYFTFPAHDLPIEISSVQSSFVTRSPVDLRVNTPGNTDTASTDLSVAVYRLDDLQGIDDNNIQTYLWLNADLKGYIESPGYYFSKQNTDAAAAIDNLMLTQGWRRFDWKDVVKENIPEPKYPAEHTGHIVTGKVVNSATGKPMEKVETFISVPGRNSNTKVATSNESGEIMVEFKTLRGATEMIVQTSPETDSLARVEINTPFSDEYSDTKPAPFKLSVAREKTLAERSMGVRVQNVFTGPELKRFVNPYDTTSEFQVPDRSYQIADYTRFTTMEEVMREYVGSMTVKSDSRSRFNLRLIENTSMPMSDMMFTDYFPTEPLMLVDGIPLFNTEKIMKFDPLKMRKLEVYNKRFITNNSSYAGIMSWTTNDGSLADIELDPRALVINYEAMQLKREFYSPVYDVPNIAANIPDYRTLLYWGYDIPSDNNGERHVRFYSSDSKGKYVAVVEGLNASGRFGAGMYRFEVK
jgi:hypothetical protein